MLPRLHRQLKENLLRNLGEIARSRLKDLNLSAECFRLASEINPDNRVRHEILAELFVMIPGRWEEAGKEHQIHLRQDPKRVESCRALRRIYQDAGKADESWYKNLYHHEVLCGDLATAAKRMTRVPSLVTDLAATQRITEPVVFATSDGYFRLRKELGVALGAG